MIISYKLTQSNSVPINILINKLVSYLILLKSGDGSFFTTFVPFLLLWILAVLYKNKLLINGS